MAYTWNGYTYNSTDSYVYFDRDPYTYTSGTGYWVDNYRNAPWNYIANHISWEVRNSRIYIYFHEDNYEIQISNYYLDNNHFRGQFWAGSENWEFDLVHTSSRNWKDYDWGWSDPYYYAPGKDGAKPAERPQRTVVPPTK